MSDERDVYTRALDLADRALTVALRYRGHPDKERLEALAEFLLQEDAEVDPPWGDRKTWRLGIEVVKGEDVEFIVHAEGATLQEAIEELIKKQFKERVDEKNTNA